MIKKIPDSHVFKIVLMFLVWRILLIAVSVLSIQFIPLNYFDRFLGGGPKNYMLAPEIFSWANFDGEHYLSIAIFGYKGLEQAFFPPYPVLISFFARPFSPDLSSFIFNSTIVGLIISNLSFLIALILLWELIKIDYPGRIAYLTITLLLVFPTSFYFGAVYSESLFLLLAVLSFYQIRKGRWMQGSFFGMLSSATRIFGVVLFPSLLIEAFKQRLKLPKMLWLFLIPLGLFAYMFYQYISVGDPLAFYRLQKLVGEQHQSGLTLLPQVYFRYIKMLLTVDMKSPIYQTIILEFFLGVIFFLLPIYGYFKKIRLSYLGFAMLGFLLPTFQGSFSSVPRYVIVLFPGFIALSLWVDSLPKQLKIIFITTSAVLLCIQTSLFVRGYWIA